MAGNVYGPQNDLYPRGLGAFSRFRRDALAGSALFPLRTGQWIEMDKQDNLGNKWTVGADVLEPGETDEIVAIVDLTVPYGGPFKA